MCGFVGTFSPTALSSLTPSILKEMAELITHRGPDDSGVWCDEEAGIGLANRRLSIVDLSPAGHQPMASPSGRYMIVYNGEIYNFEVVRKSLPDETIAWRGHSDTEVLLAAIDAWGLEATLPKISGMFAFALWDKQERTLTFARDRIGKKPLYYGLHKGELLFGSELKAFRGWPDFTPTICKQALSEYLRYSYIPAAQSIYRGICKLPPGHVLTLSQADIQRGQLPASRAWWCVEYIARKGQGLNTTKLSDNDATDQLETLITDAVRTRLIGDVPIGAFLSGGIDSSVVAALMQTLSRQPIKTFSIGFDDKSFDEAGFAKDVATHLGTDHTELIVTPQETMAAIPQMAHIFDEPFADASQIPTYLVSKLAREKVTVALSGDGGDELFCGYNRYLWGPGLWRKINRIPGWARSPLGALLEAVPEGLADRAARFLNTHAGTNFPEHMRIKLQKVAQGLHAHSLYSFYQNLLATFTAPDAIMVGDAGNGTQPSQNKAPLDAPVACMMLWDQQTYLPDDILVKVDRASMAVSLEARAPLLDPALVEFAWRLPHHLELRDGTGKWLLRQVLYRHVPRPLIDRPKAGFDIPVGQWIKSDLRDWAENLLDEKRMKEQGLFETHVIRQIWQDHLSGRRDNTQKLWTLLMFQQWMEQC